MGLEPLPEFRVRGGESTEDDVGVPRQPLGDGVQHHVDAVLERPAEDRRIEGVVGDDEPSGGMGGLGEDCRLGDFEHGIGRAFEPQHELFFSLLLNFGQDCFGVRNVYGPEREAAEMRFRRREAERARVGMFGHDHDAARRHQGQRCGGCPEAGAEDECGVVGSFEPPERLLEGVPGGVRHAPIDAVPGFGGAGAEKGGGEDDRGVHRCVVFPWRATCGDYQGVRGQGGVLSGWGHGIRVVGGGVRPGIAAGLWSIRLVSRARGPHDGIDFHRADVRVVRGAQRAARHWAELLGRCRGHSADLESIEPQRSHRLDHQE